MYVLLNDIEVFFFAFEGGHPGKKVITFEFSINPYTR